MCSSDSKPADEHMLEPRHYASDVGHMKQLIGCRFGRHKVSLKCLTYGLIATHYGLRTFLT